MKSLFFQKIDDRLFILRINSHINIDIRLYNNITFFHKILNRFYAKLIRNKLYSVRVNPSSVFNFLYNFPEIFEFYDNAFKVYVCYDEWPQMWRKPTKPNFLKFKYQSWITSKYENKTIRKADLTLASHLPLKEKVDLLNKKSELFFHGHEFSPKKNIHKVNNVLIKVGFMGHISYRLIDNWLLKVLNEKGMELILIGPVDKKYFNIQKFEKFENFKLKSAVKGDELLSLLQSMDVLIMPYNISIPENNVQTVSNKFFQYVASCRPIIISNMPHYIDMPEGVIYRASTSKEFIDQIYRAVDEDCEKYQEIRAEIALKNTWDSRGDFFIKNSFRRKKHNNEQ